LQREERVAIIGDNSPEWLIAELAVQSIGSTPTGAFTDCTPEELAFMVNKAEVTAVIVKDQEQMDKVLVIRDRCPQVKFVVYWDPKGVEDYDQTFFLSFERVQECGREVDRKNSSLFEKMVAEGNPDDSALLLFTSGTGGLPKAAVHSHQTLILEADMWLKANRFNVTDNYISFAPLAWIPEQLFAVIVPLYAGYIVNFPERPESTRMDIREISPDIIAMSPRLWEDLSSMVLSRMADANFVRRIPYQVFLSLGNRRADLQFEKRKLPFGLRLLCQIGEVFLYRPLRDNIGLRNIKHAYNGGADLGSDTFRFYKAIGVNIKQVYGLTESGGISTTHRDDDVKFNTVGKPLEGCEIKISDDGEILLRGAPIFKGYYKDPEATQKAFTVDGWLHSGDAGLVDEDGHLVCIGRLKDLMDLPGGGKFSPVFIETKLKFSPYVKDAVVFGGERRPYVAIIVVIDYETVSQWAEKRGIPFTTYTDLSQKSEVYELIERDVRWVNNVLPDPAKIKRFGNFYKELDPDEAELTRSRKLRRSFFVEKYPELVDSLYGDKELVSIESQVKYHDGKVGKIMATMRVKKV
jgi:long-chain acyl-CoA synthetase